MPTIALDRKLIAPSDHSPSSSVAHPSPRASLGEAAAAGAGAGVLSVVSQAVNQPRLPAYNSHAAAGEGAAAGFLSTPLEQYRLQLYNYAVHMDRLRCPQYHARQQLLPTPTTTTASAVAAFGYSNVAAAAAVAASIRDVYTPSSRLALSMSLFPPRLFQPEEPKPQHSYIGLIAMAILSSAETKLVLSDIYQYILDNYPYFRARGPGWRNSIRHNLSLNDCFVKSGRSANGKGHYWAIHPANIEDFRKGDFRRRKAQRKVRKHMGLSVDDEGTDSPSPPPFAVSPPPTHPCHQNLQTSTHAYFSYLQHHQQQQHPHSAHQQFLPAHHHDHGYEQSLAAAGAAADRKPEHYIHPAEVVALPTPQNAYNKQLSIIKETTTTTASVIANLYSQTRKRQFDVASLLAPDVDLDAGDERGDGIERAAATTTTTTKRTLITKLSVQQHHHHQLQYTPKQLVQFTTQQQLQHNLSELDEQDIDVVTSDVEEDLEGECDEIDEAIDEETELEEEENNNSKNSCSTTDARQYCSPDRELAENQQHQHPKYRADTTTEQTATFSEYPRSSSPLSDKNIAQKLTNPQQQHPHFHRLIGQVPNDFNSAVDPSIFGRYYGTYMAAAAAQQVVARHIRSSISFPLAATATEAMEPRTSLHPGINAAAHQSAAQQQQQQQRLDNQPKPIQQPEPLQQN